MSLHHLDFKMLSTLSTNLYT